MTTTIETTSTTGLIGMVAALNACKGDVVITNGYDQDKADYINDHLNGLWEDGDKSDTTEYVLQDGVVDGQPVTYIRATDEAGYIIDRGGDDTCVMDADD